MCVKIGILLQKSFQPSVVSIQSRPKNELYLGRSEIEKWNHAGHDLQTSNVRRKFEIWRDIQEKKNSGFISRNLVSKIIKNAINSKKKRTNISEIEKWEPIMVYPRPNHCLRSKCSTYLNQHFKGQSISKWNFGVIKSPKKPTKFLTDFLPSFIGQKSD